MPRGYYVANNLKRERCLMDAYSGTSEIDSLCDSPRMKRNEAEREMHIMFAMCRDGSAVHVFGNTISVSGRGMSETYVLCGNMLTGPHGFRSMNCRGIDEAFCMVCGVHGGKNW